MGITRTGKILIVDDERDIRSLIREILEDEGYEVADAPHSEAAYAYIAAQGMPDLVILDIWLENSDRDGMEILADLKKRNAALPVLMISGHGNIEMAVNAIKLGAFEFIEKPFNTERLLELVEKAMSSNKRSAKMGRLELVSEAPDMQLVIKLAAKAATGEGRVMLLGDSGAGRQHVASWIHQESSRKMLEFMCLSSRGLSAVDLERAISKVAGGTLMLRDVEFLEDSAQKVLLRAINTKVECRIIVSASPDFSAESSGFLPDLYERLAVNIIEVPGLNARKADIAKLTCFFIDRFLALWGRGDIQYKLSDVAVSYLQTMRFTHHLAELQSLCVLAAVRLLKEVDKTGDVALVDEGFFSINAGTSAENEVFKPLQNWLSQDLRTAREDFERWYFENLSERFEGNISQMASFSGMERTALHRKLKSLKEALEVNDNARMIS